MEKMIQSREEEDFYKLLTVAAIESSLQGLIVFDATEKDLLKFADRWMQILTIAYQSPTQVLTLNSATTEENLWGHFGISANNRQSSQIIWQPSKLVQHDRNPLLVVIPDLTRLSLSAMRACVTLLDSELASLQRDGIDHTWQPRFWCIAGCQSDRLGEVSPHLLDRFALRCKSPNVKHFEGLSPLERFERYDRASESNLENLSQTALQLAERSQEIIANRIMATMSDEAIARVHAYFTKKVPLGMRRLFALSRLARGLASLENEEVVSIAMVDRAAKLLGLSQNLSLPIQPVIEPVKPISRKTQEPKVTTQADPQEPDDVSGKEQTQSVVKPDVEAIFPTVGTEPEILGNPYLEDDCPAMRELEPLKIPIASARSPRSGFGHPIGTQPATNLEDISLFGTVFEAAKFQNYRRNLPRFKHEPHHFRIWLSDLRSYRRIPMPQYQLICAIDFTCLQDRLWQDALLPHLRDWAYVNRASISIIRIGVKGAREPLRSHLIQSRNLLAPEVFQALEGEAGAATPLAHGLDLAARTARAALQHGRNQMVRVRLVVLSDGRGNIPLQASLDGVLNHRVSYEGIEDALKAAKVLGEIPRLEIVLLDPQPMFYPDNVTELAEAMGAVVEKVEIKTPSLPEINSRDVLEPISLGERW
jgi:magnesium chelatase subunit D